MSAEVRCLDRAEYAKWDALVQASPQGSVSCLSWWLDAVGQNIRVLGYFENGRLVAGVPLHLERMFGMTLYRKPKLTNPWGVVIEPLDGKRTTVVTREMEALEVLAKHLNAIRGSIVMSFHPSLQNWLPFSWHGFNVSVGATHVIEDLDSLDRVRRGFMYDVRRQIAKAIDTGIRVEPCNADEALKLFRATYHRQGQQLPYSGEYFRRLYLAAKSHNAGECFLARDGQGRAHAAAFVVWDKRRAHYVAAGGDPELRSSGAGVVLVWHVLQFAAQHVGLFDFNGSAVRPIEQFVRSFGGRQTYYPRVMRWSLLPRVGLAALRRI
jgi:Acetyltransferase (GNAT) domain